MPNGNLPDRLRHPLSARRGAYPTPAETYCAVWMDGMDWTAAIMQRTHARSPYPVSVPFIVTVKERARMSSEAGVI